MADETVRAHVSAAAGGRHLFRHALLVGQQLTFGRDRTADVCFPDEARLSRLAGTIRGLTEGVSVANLSSTHHIVVARGVENARLRATSAGQPIATALFLEGVVTISWPGSVSSLIRVEVLQVATPTVRASTLDTSNGSTFQPLRLNSLTKEFVVALLLSRPRLRDLPCGSTAPDVPALTRLILEEMNSYALLRGFDTNRDTRAQLVARTHEHLKSLREKLVLARLAERGTRLSPELIAALLVENNVIRLDHLELLHDPNWLQWQEREWEA